MYVDVNIGGSTDGTSGAEFSTLNEQVRTAMRIGCDGVWSTEVARDPFLPLVVAAGTSSSLQIGTAVAVAFARNPMSMAVVANDLNTLSHGRFVLGLGSQIQAHITRRFSMPWSAPAERMREYVLALQHIWSAWRSGERLDFRGEHYQHTLMTPMFTPESMHFGSPRVMVAAVGPKMTTVAAHVADGLHVHAFTTARYLRDVTIPIVLAGLEASGRTRDEFTTSYPGLIATGSDEVYYLGAVQQVRHQLAFYGATPAYRPVLELHGWGDLHTELHRLSKLGDWATMTGLIDDEVLNTLAIAGTPKDVGSEVIRRFDGLIDRFTLYTPYSLDETTAATLVEEIKTASRAQSVTRRGYADQ